MMRPSFPAARILVLAVLLLCGCTSGGGVRNVMTDPGTPEFVTFRSGELVLKGLIWRPAGPGPHPAVVFNHGSERYHDVHFALLGPAFAREGYVFFAPYRRGQGLSADQGAWVLDTLGRVAQEQGMLARGRKVVELLKTEQIGDLLAAIAHLTARPDVDKSRIAIVGNSFGGILTMMMAERGDPGVKAAINMAGAALNWSRSPDIKEWMFEMARAARVPVLFMQAENDEDTGPSRELAGEMTRLGKTNRMRIFPPFGKTAADGHSFGYLGGEFWVPEAVRFLRENMR